LGRHPEVEVTDKWRSTSKVDVSWEAKAQDHVEDVGHRVVEKLHLLATVGARESNETGMAQRNGEQSHKRFVEVRLEGIDIKYASGV
jgi:hypothetical protein